MANDNEPVVLPESEKDQLALLTRLLDPAQGGKLNEDAVRSALVQRFGDRVRTAVTPGAETLPKPKVELPTPIEITPEVLAECLAGLERDYERGIVEVDETKGVDHFRDALSEDKTAGTPWATIKEKLEADDGESLKEAAKLQGKGTLIGVYPDGKLCIKDRGNEPVIHATLDGKQIEITTDTPNRDELMQRVVSEGQFADYWEIRSAVHGKGLELPPYSPGYEKKGVVAATEAVTGEDFVRSVDGKSWKSAVLECGNVSRSSDVRVVNFFPTAGRAIIDVGRPEFQRARRGAVRVLRG